jgi:hypothetical protein
MAQSTGLPLVFRVRDKESTQRLNADSNGSDGGCIGLLRKTSQFSGFIGVRVCRDQTQTHTQDYN